MQNITELRNQIDIIDEKIISLLGERFLLTRHIGEHKKREGKSIVDTEREIFILNKMQQLGKKYRLSSTLIREVWNIIFAQSRKEQRKDE